MDEVPQFEPRITVMIFGTDYRNGHYHVVSTDPERIVLPTERLYALSDIQSDVDTLLETYLNLDVGWVNPRCCHASNVKGDLNIYFACWIPLDSVLLNGAKFLPTNTTDADLQIYEQIRRYEMV